jgi:2,4-dienoyl-CoA reductase-like NADH-dependent reductase (Old Yellow Enzyme family)/thioredoxin reductase
MGTRLANENGGVSQRQIDYYKERAKGGVGTIIVECTAVDYPQGAMSLKNLTIHENSYIGGHNELVEAIQAYGTKVFCQIYHVGRCFRPANVMGIQPVAPSAIPSRFFNVMPKELTIREIEDIVKKFIEAAVRVKTSGYDGVELHGTHGYLIAQFMSLSSNCRRDRYGGDLIKRMEFPLEIIKGIRKELGPQFPIIFRLSGDEFIDGGIGLKESKIAAKILEEAGIDTLDISAGTYESMVTMIEPMSYAQGWKIYLAEEIKRIVKIPVIGVGVIRTPEFAESILRDKKADFIALGRALLADPYWPQKAKEGREEEIIPCISCNIGCMGGRIFRNLHIRCATNPLTGREQLKEALVPATNKKRVFVIGGGPAGMAAALTANMRGHAVTLFEKDNRLGGQLRLAAKPPGKEKMDWYLGYLLNQLKKQRIKTKLGHSITKQTIIQGKPDAVIISKGAVPIVPRIPGVESQRVSSAWSVLGGGREIKNKVVLIVGGGTVGCEVGLFLASNNKKIIVADMLEDIAMDMEPINRMDLMRKIKESKIKVLLGRKLARIESDGVVFLYRGTKRERIKVDMVVLAMGVVPANDLVKDLEGEIKNIYVVGDCYSPRKMIDAVYEGFLAGINI